MNFLSYAFRARFGAAALLGALTVISSASASIERVVEKSFTAAAPGTIRAFTDSGVITVETGTDNQVRIVAHEHVRAKSEGQATRILRGLNLQLAADGGTIVAEARYDEGGFAQYGKAHNPVQVDFTIIAPAGFAADLRAAKGDIRVVVPAGAGYAIDAAASGGKVDVKGVNVTAFTGGAGEAQFVGRVGAGGAALHLRTGDGNITLDRSSAS